VLHVSSSYEYDIDIARALGSRTGYVSRYEPPPPEREVGAAMESLQDLVQ
jgi:FMN phosphatase YigB (HAD superfamily)